MADEPGVPGNALALLLRREAVTQVLYDYCDHVDHNRVEAVLSLFSPTATFDFGFGRVFRGREELQQLFERLSLNTATSHHVSNVTVASGHEGVVEVRSVVYAFHRRAESGEEVHLWARYRDQMEHVDTGWRFRRRELRAAAEKGTDPVAGRETFYEPIPRRA